MFSPSVLLAILSAVANMCLQLARSEGVVISWWRKALRGGTLYDLSRYWESGDSILAAAAPGRGFNLVALATILAQTVYLDGPLPQKASTVVSIPVTKAVNVTALIAEELPYGYIGLAFTQGNLVPPPTGYPQIMNQTFSEIFTNYTLRTPITTNFAGCDGSCIGSIKDAGLAVNCSDEVHVPWSNQRNVTTNVTDVTVFSTGFQWDASPNLPGNTYNGDDALAYPSITYNLTYAIGRIASGGGPCCIDDYEVWWRGTRNGTLVTKQCTMYSATLLYPVILNNSTITLRTTSPVSVDHIQPVGSQNSGYFDEHDPMDSTYSTLGGITVAAQNMFNSQAVQFSSLITLNGSLASQYLNDYGAGRLSYFVTQDACAMNWRDSTIDVVNALNEIMFRTALVALNVSKYAFMNLSDPAKTSYHESWPVNISAGDTGMPEPQVLGMQQTSNITVFKSNYAYLAAALAVMMTGFLVVIPTLHGYWEMGRQTSLNPLEIAKAFNADLL
jgi:hypothetical protein